jgi:CheY-like chemotaxis protein
VPTRTALVYVALDDDSGLGAPISAIARQLPAPVRFVQFDSGALALGAFAATAPDVILLDLAMPGLGGLTVLERLKADQRLRHVPVVVLSAMSTWEKVRAAIELGADEYVPKPFHPPTLLGILRKATGLGDRQGPTARA